MKILPTIPFKNIYKNQIAKLDGKDAKLDGKDLKGHQVFEEDCIAEGVLYMFLYTWGIA